MSRAPSASLQSCFLGVCWWEMSPPPFLPTVCLWQMRGRGRERERRRDPSIPLYRLLRWSPTVSANSCITPGASQQGLHHWLSHHCIVHSLALPFCPFHWAGAPSSNSRREEEAGNGEWSMHGSSKPPDPRIQCEAPHTQRCEVSCLVQSAGLSLQCHRGCWWSGRQH